MIFSDQKKFSGLRSLYRFSQSVWGLVSAAAGRGTPCVIRELTGRIGAGGVVGSGVLLVLMGTAAAGLGVMVPPADRAEEGSGVVSAAPVTPPKSFRAGETFRDCGDCPELVVIPSGVFVMGSPITERERDFEEGPQHEVRVADVFALGKYEVTEANSGQ